MWVEYMAIIKKRISAKWGKRNFRCESNWEEINLNSYKIDKPVVVCLSGNSAITAKDANGFCKRAEILLELLTKNNPHCENVEIIGPAYGHYAKVSIPDMTDEERKKFIKKYPSSEDYMKENPDSVEHRDIGNLSGDEVGEFVDRVLLPCCMDEKGKKISIDKACKNLSLITFFSWCHGANEVNSILNDLSIRCHEIGYSIGDIYRMMSSMMQVTYAPVIEGNMCPTVRVDSLLDYNNIALSEDNSDVNGIKIKYEYSEENRKRFFDTIHVLSSKLTNLSKKEVNEHSVKYLDRDDGWDIKDGHPNADCVSQIISWVLCRSVENSFENLVSKNFVPKKPLLGLKQEIESIQNSFDKEELMMK